MGGVTGSGGKVDSGGIAGTGGKVGTGGLMGTGGATVTGSGGKVGSGGIVGTGGRVGAGGLAGTGGKVGAGGKVGTGGNAETGGNAGTGGKVGAGGIRGTGGVGLDGGDPSVKLAWAGVRSSGYGISGAGFSSFPSAEKWTTAMKTMAGFFPGATPSATIWLVGEVDYDQKGMILEFPKPDDGKTYSALYQFARTDKHEPYLSHFDTQSVQVYLEIEPGDADIPTLIDLVLSRYKNHPSVIGLAIDAEWIGKTSDTGTERPVTDTQAKDWETLVKSYSSSYRLLLKHFDEGNLPKTYRGDIIFANDDEMNDSYSSFKGELKTFADFFYPNDVMFQIGYPSDRDWWSKLASPIPQTIGNSLQTQTRQRFGVLWVDFSINDSLIGLIP
jgi:hypothetical protein